MNERDVVYHPAYYKYSRFNVVRKDYSLNIDNF